MTQYSVDEIADVFAGKPRSRAVVDEVLRRLATLKPDCRGQVPLLDAMSVLCGQSPRRVLEGLAREMKP